MASTHDDSMTMGGADSGGGTASTGRAVRIATFGGPEVLQVAPVPIPQPVDDEVLVRVHAASVNPVDGKTRAGEFPPVGEADLPVTLGRDPGDITTLEDEGSVEEARQAWREIRDSMGN